MRASLDAVCGVSPPLQGHRPPATGMGRAAGCRRAGAGSCLDGAMTMQGEAAPSPRGWVREQVEKIAETGTTRSVHIMERPVVLLTMRGVSGKVRKVPLMRVEHGGVYAAVASQGGAPEHPKWYANLRKNPVIELQDDTRSCTARARE